MKWISVKDRLPERNGKYLVYAPSYRGGSSSSLVCVNGIMFSTWRGNWSIEVGYHKRPNCVEYWQPLPDLPTKEKCDICNELDSVYVWSGDSLLKNGYPNFCPECGTMLERIEES